MKKLTSNSPRICSIGQEDSGPHGRTLEWTYPRCPVQYFLHTYLFVYVFINKHNCRSRTSKKLILAALCNVNLFNTFHNMTHSMDTIANHSHFNFWRLEKISLPAWLLERSQGEPWRSQEVLQAPLPHPLHLKLKLQIVGCIGWEGPLKWEQLQLFLDATVAFFCGLWDPTLTPPTLVLLLPWLTMLSCSWSSPLLSLCSPLLQSSGFVLLGHQLREQVEWNWEKQVSQ